MEDEPKQCSLMEKSALCKPEELTLQPKGCKRNASLELFPSKSSHMLLAHKIGFCGFKHAGSFQSLPIHEASQALFWGTKQKDIPPHKTVLRMCLSAQPMKNSERFIILCVTCFCGKETREERPRQLITF